jgi:hypothetical protein
MTSTVPDVASEQKTEDELWTTYMVALARKEANLRLKEEGWHAFALTGCRSDVERQIWYRTSDLWEKSSDAAKAAYVAWQRVAYPLHNIPLHEDELSS